MSAKRIAAVRETRRDQQRALRRRLEGEATLAETVVDREFARRLRALLAELPETRGILQ